MFLHVVCMGVRYMDGSFPANLLPPTWKSPIQTFPLCPCPSIPTEKSRRSSSNSAGLPPGSPPTAIFGAPSGTQIQELDKKKKNEHLTMAPS